MYYLKFNIKGWIFGIWFLWKALLFSNICCRIWSANFLVNLRNEYGMFLVTVHLVWILYFASGFSFPFIFSRWQWKECFSIPFVRISHFSLKRSPTQHSTRLPLNLSWHQWFRRILMSHSMSHFLWAACRLRVRQWEDLYLQGN